MLRLLEDMVTRNSKRLRIQTKKEARYMIHRKIAEAVLPNLSASDQMIAIDSIEFTSPNKQN